MPTKTNLRGLGRWCRTNQGIGILLASVVALLFLYLWQQDWFHREQRDGITLGFFPALGLVAMLMASMALAVDKWRHVEAEEMADVGWRDLVWALLFCLAALVMYRLMEPLGLPLASALFLAGMIYLLGLRPWYLAPALAVVIALIILAVFMLLGIRLPGGIVPFS